MKQSLTPLQRQIEKYIAQRRTLKEAAMDLGISRVYLWRLRTGDHATPSEKLLEKLGLQRVEEIKLL
jgi:hypothetical protein